MSCNGCGHPKFPHKLHGNGDVHFIKEGIEPPPDLKGYERDKEDDWLFRPIKVGYLPCVSAIVFTARDSAGCPVLGRLCTHVKIKGITVLPAQCAVCPLRGNIEPSKKGTIQVSRCKTILQRIVSHIIDYAQFFTHVSKTYTRKG